MQVVWFKPDLRLADDAPLAKAGKSGQLTFTLPGEYFKSMEVEKLRHVDVPEKRHDCS